MDQQRETGLPPHAYMAVTQGGCQKGKERRGRRKERKRRERRGQQDEQKRVEKEKQDRFVMRGGKSL